MSLPGRRAEAYTRAFRPWNGTGSAMIFGFNTDIKHADTIYHVQSEPRTSDLLLETQVFVRGQCIGKLANSYAHRVSEDFSDQQLHELLKTQHRDVLDAIRQGSVAQMLARESPVPTLPSPTLTLEWVNSELSTTSDPMLLRFRVLLGNTGVAGARLVSRLDTPTPAFSLAVSDHEGVAEMSIPLGDDLVGETILYVQASCESWSATRKFRIKRTQ